MSAWFQRFGPPGRVRLVCLPFAGGGAGVFQSWPGRVPEGVEVVAVRLPGRETRLRERPIGSWPDVVHQLTHALHAEIEPPYLLFGHSLGAMIAYQTVVSGPPQLPERLILAGCRSPEVPSQLPRLHHLPDEEFATGVGDLASTPPEVLASAGLRRLLFPMLRADLLLAETWPPPAPTPAVPVPLAVVGADRDAVAPPWSLAGWQQLAGAGLSRYQVPGSHFFIQDPQPFARALAL
ncbi:thioesterase [Kineosporia sp. J2-2]|uniref:Thioesterase n=1 Tax=Kineosporia corallincola TaxID=2835133 RepID=A0ABS5TRQ9_9ACTN|nr:alpha/beta fold hydrolase [Kineosporia corallincola]MBT0773486.1 thioesterase [Kineosporia corallincola]